MLYVDDNFVLSFVGEYGFCTVGTLYPCFAVLFRHQLLFKFPPPFNLTFYPRLILCAVIEKFSVITPVYLQSKHYLTVRLPVL